MECRTLLIVSAALALMLTISGCQTSGSTSNPVTQGAAAPEVLDRYAGVSFSPPQGVDTLNCRNPAIPEFRWAWACAMAADGRIIRIEFWRDSEPDEAEMRDWLARYFFRPSTAKYSNDITFEAGRSVPVALADGRTVTATFGKGRQLSTGDHSHRIAILIIPASFNNADKTMTILFGRNQWAAPPVTQAEVQAFLDGMTFPVPKGS